MFRAYEPGFAAMMHEKKTAHPLTFGLALVAGAGLIVMIVALGLGAIQGDAANTSTFNGVFAIGVALLLVGIIGWALVVQPWTHFDDINVPMDTGHGHAAPAHDEGAAIVVAPAHDVEPHTHS
jgi:hypothetical protein